MGNRLNTDQVRSIVTSKGWVMLSNQYTGYTQKIAVMCPENHIQKKRLMDINNESKCLKCHYISGVAGKKTHSYDHVKNHIESFGYKLLSKEYRRQSDLLDMRCINEHRCCISFKKFRAGRRCRYCDPSRKKDFEEVKDFVEKNGFTLFSEEYKPSKKIKIKCKNGHVMDKMWSSFYSRPACGECSNPYKNLTKEEYRKLYGKSDKGIYNRYKGDCKRRGRKARDITMDLDFEEFSSIINQPCSYCGVENCRGIDRLDSSLSYTIDNSQPCCKICNQMKNNMDEIFFLEHIDKIIKYKGKNK